MFNSNLSRLDQTNESKLNTETSSLSFSYLNNEDSSNNTILLCDTSKAWSMLKSGEVCGEEPIFYVHRIDISKYKIEDEEEFHYLNTIKDMPSHGFEYLAVIHFIFFNLEISI